MVKLTGAMTALVTPFDVVGQVDEESLRNLVDFQIDGGIDGLVAVGTTGESATLSKAEKLDVIRIVIEQARGRVPVIAGTGSNDTAASVAMTRAALELGADACLAVVPYYNKPNQEGLYRHFCAVAEVGLPVVLYNVPGRTVISLTADTVGRLSAVPGVVSIKEATGDMRVATDMMALTGERITYLSGDDFTTFPFVTLGGHGAISVVSNVAPGLVHDLVVAGSEGRLADGQPLHHKVNRLARLCFSDSNPIPAKAMLAAMGVIGRPDVRLPLAPASGALVEVMTAALKAEGVL